MWWWASLIFVLFLQSRITLTTPTGSQSTYYRQPLADQVPRCTFLLAQNSSNVDVSRGASSPQALWSESTNSASLAMEFLPHTQHVAHFYCQCSPIGNQYRGSLSQILSDPLSTIPLLHLVNANVTILVELKNCLKLKLALDVTELLLQRAMSSANVDFVLKISESNRVNIPKVSLSSNQTFVLAMSDIKGPVSISGKIECIGCQLNHYHKSATRAVDTLFALFVDSVSSLAIEDSQVETPLRLTARNVANVSISGSNFIIIPWPGIYVFNSSQVSLTRNAFKFVAPRSMVFKHGQHLEVSHNSLQVASALDVSQFARLAIFCNHPRLDKLAQQCTTEEGFKIGAINQSTIFLLLGFVATIYGHFWILLITVILLVLALYKFFLGINEPDDPPIVANKNLSDDGRQRNNGCERSTGSNRGQTYDVKTATTASCNCPWTCLMRDPNSSAMNEDEYSNSSRLHLAGGADYPSYKSVSPSFEHVTPTNVTPVNRKSGPGFSNYSTESPLLRSETGSSAYIKQLERLSLTSSPQLNPVAMSHSPTSSQTHCTSPIGYDLWQRNSNGISHIDSDETDTKSSAEDTSQHQRYQQEPFISSVLLYNHPSSNYAYKNGQERKPVWQY